MCPHRQTRRRGVAGGRDAGDEVDARAAGQERPRAESGAGRPRAPPGRRRMRRSRCRSVDGAAAGAPRRARRRTAARRAWRRWSSRGTPRVAPPGPAAAASRRGASPARRSASEHGRRGPISEASSRITPSASRSGRQSARWRSSQRRTYLTGAGSFLPGILARWPPAPRKSCTVACLKWGTRYSADYVNNLRAMVARNLTVAHRFLCITDDPSGVEC